MNESLSRPRLDIATILAIALIASGLFLGSLVSRADAAPTYEGLSDLVAFQTNAGSMWYYQTPEYSGEKGHSEPFGIGMAANSSPSVSGWSAGITAFQTNEGQMWTFQSPNLNKFGLGMAANTSPSIAGGGNCVRTAFQANSGMLYTLNVSTASAQNLFDGMKPGTSPSINHTSGCSSWEIAFQSNEGQLIINTTGSLYNPGLGMMAGTSPSMYSGMVAFQANTGHLWILDVPGHSAFDTGLAMAPGTSPALTYTESGYEVAYQSNTGNLNTYTGPGALHQYGLAMKAGTSPSITRRYPHGTEIAFQANTGNLFTFGTWYANNPVNSGLGMRGGTSPGIASTTYP